MKRRALLPLLLLVPLASAAAAEAFDIELEVPNPTRGKPVVVTLAGAGEGGPFSLRAVYRPGSRTEKEEEVGPFGGSGTLEWTPRDAGITRLVVDGADGVERIGRNVAVRFDSPPASGLAIFFFAGALLFGGATLAVRRALEAGDGEPRKGPEKRRRRD